MKQTQKRRYLQSDKWRNKQIRKGYYPGFDGYANGKVRRSKRNPVYVYMGEVDPVKFHEALMDALNI